MLRPSELFFKKTNQTGLYNIQSMDNIPSIMREGLLSNERAEQIAHTSIAMNSVQQRRAAVVVPDGLRLHQYANVYFDPHNPMLSARRNHNLNICILKFNCTILDIPGVIISDRNASSEYATFYPPAVGMESVNFRLVYARYWTDEDYFKQMEKKSVKCAEVLVPHFIPFSYVTCAAVINNVAAQKLRDTGFDRNVVVFPEIYF